MELVHFKEMARLIGPSYRSKAVPEVIRALVDPHQYIPFYRKDDLEVVILSACMNRGWDKKSIVAVYSDIDLKTSNGMIFGSCLIVPNTTSEQLATLIERGLKMKAFL
jgi:hypothetical protein